MNNRIKQNQATVEQIKSMYEYQGLYQEANALKMLLSDSYSRHQDDNKSALRQLGETIILGTIGGMALTGFLVWVAAFVRITQDYWTWFVGAGMVVAIVLVFIFLRDDK